jgi:hypothetical protein
MLVDAVRMALARTVPRFTRDDLISSLSATWIETEYIGEHMRSQCGKQWAPDLLPLKNYVENMMTGMDTKLLVQFGRNKQPEAVYEHHALVLTPAVRRIRNEYASMANMDAIKAGDQSSIPFPQRIMDLLLEVADRQGTETRGPWEDGNGAPLQDDAEAALSWINSSAKVLEKTRASRDFYKRRCDELQKAQSSMRDPERTMVCDILANGSLLAPEVAGNRYKQRDGS